MKPLSRSSFTCIAAALVVLMVATRFFGHVGGVHLPDASLAVFFLGGLYLRRHLAFAGFALLAVLIDWVAISYAGVSSFCVTVAYGFLLPAYAVLWYGGRLHASRFDGSAKSLWGAFAVALVCASVSFGISNGSFYWIGGRVAQPNWTGYLAGVWRWGPLFVRVAMAYVVAGLATHAAAQALARRLARDGQAVRA